MQRWKKKPLGRFKSMSPSKYDPPVVLSLNQQKGDASRRSPERSEDCQSWDFLCKSSSACHQNSDFCSLKTTRVDRTKIFLSAIYYRILSINHLSWFPLGILSKKALGIMSAVSQPLVCPSQQTAQTQTAVVWGFHIQHLGRSSSCSLSLGGSCADCFLFQRLFEIYFFIQWILPI